jgi:hypothetical protein
LALIENNEVLFHWSIEIRKVFRTASAKRLTGWTDEEFDSIPESEYTLTAHWQDKA